MMEPETYVAFRDRIAKLRASVAAVSIAFAKAEGNSFSPPQAARSAAARGLELRAKWKRGGLDNSEASDQGIGSGVQRAVNLKNGDAISLGTVKRMHAFFGRHQKNYRPDEKEADGGPTAGTIAWLLWGGNAGKAWARSVVGDAVSKGDTGPASGPAASDVHVPGTDWKKPAKLKARIDKLTADIEKATRRAGKPRIPGDGDGDGIPNESRRKKPRTLNSLDAPNALPKPPKFITSDAKVKAENEGHARKLFDLASKGDIAGLKAYAAFNSKSQKLVAYKQALLAAASAPKPRTKPADPPPAPSKPLPNFKGALVDQANVNAASHNAKVLLIEQHAKNGAADKIIGMSFGVNTYGKKQAKLANETLAALGSKHQVTPGQKAGTHPGLKGTPPAPPAPPAPPKPAPAAKPAPAPAPAAAPAPAPAAAPAAAPKPSTVAPYKPAKTLDAAVAQLEAYGMKVTRLTPTTQSDYDKQKIASAPPEKKALYEKWYGPKKAKGVLTDASFLQVLNAVGPEAERMAKEFPKLLGGVNLMQKSPGPKALGTYTFASKAIALRKPSGFAPVTPPKPGEVPWSISSSGVSDTRIVDTFRHEAGHALDIGVHKWGLSKSLVQTAKSNAASLGWPQLDQGGDMALLKYVSSKHSKYGGTKPEEATAELVALYTSASYKPGTIAKPLEDVLDDYLKKKEPFGKAKGDGIGEDEDFISVSIPEPPKGYELESANGIDIRFRAPDGSIVQYVDMVNAGLFGSEKDDE